MHICLDMYGDIYYVSIHIIFYSIFLYFSNLPVCMCTHIWQSTVILLIQLTLFVPPLVIAT